MNEPLFLRPKYRGSVGFLVVTTEYAHIQFRPKYLIIPGIWTGLHRANCKYVDFHTNVLDSGDIGPFSLLSRVQQLVYTFYALPAALLPFYSYSLVGSRDIDTHIFVPLASLSVLLQTRWYNNGYDNPGDSKSVQMCWIWRGQGATCHHPVPPSPYLILMMSSIIRLTTKQSLRVVAKEGQRIISI
jgi:hypothetical protein